MRVASQVCVDMLQKFYPVRLDLWDENTGKDVMRAVDAEGRAMIGFGHRLSEDEKKSALFDGRKITLEEAEKIFHDDVAFFTQMVEGILSRWGAATERRADLLTQEQVDAAVSLVFDQGWSSRLRYSDAWLAIYAGDHDASTKFTTIDKVQSKANGEKASAELAKRRALEAQVYDAATPVAAAAIAATAVAVDITKEMTPAKAKAPLKGKS